MSATIGQTSIEKDFEAVREELELGRWDGETAESDPFLALRRIQIALTLEKERTEAYRVALAKMLDTSPQSHDWYCSIARKSLREGDE